MEFWGLFFGGVGVGQNIFGFKGGGYISLGESGSFSPFTHFEMLDLKISKILPAAPLFLIFTFSDLQQMQGFK